MKRTVLFLTLLSAAVGLSAQQPKPLQITSETKFVSLPDHEWVSPLVDGVWTVKANYAYAFFLDDGRKLFDFDWAVSGNRDPQMLEGAVIMFKKGETFGKPQYILYRNGAVKELPASWTGAATNFVDGVALIGRKPQKGGMEYIYINTSGEQVYGKLTSEPDFFDGQNWTVPPLRRPPRLQRPCLTELHEEMGLHRRQRQDCHPRALRPSALLQRRLRPRQGRQQHLLH